MKSCLNAAAFRTRSKPAYCGAHIQTIFRQAGVELIEQFAKPTIAVLTRCLECGVEAHYRFEYVANNSGAPVCRACSWRNWAVMARATSGAVPRVISMDEARLHAERSGYEYIRPLTQPSLTHDPHLTRCPNCGKIEAQRLADISFLCACSKHARRPARPFSKTLGAPP